MSVKKTSGRKKTTAPKGIQEVSAHYRNAPLTHVRNVLGSDKPITVAMIREGLSPLAIVSLSKQLELSTEKTLQFVSLSKQTYARRQKTGKLTAKESDRVWRIAGLVTEANQLLGDEDAAAEWLRTSSPALDGENPLERASTEIGAAEVKQLIGRLEHGIAT